MLRIIISSYTIILIMFSSQKMRSLFEHPPLEDIFMPFRPLNFWTPVAYFGTPCCLLLGTRKYGVPWLLFEWEIKYHISIRNIFETKHLTNFPSFGNTYAVTPIDTPFPTSGHEQCFVAEQWLSNFQGWHPNGSRYGFSKTAGFEKSYLDRIGCHPPKKI